MMYETRVNMQSSHQVVLSVILTNLTTNQIKEMEFNVLDSLNTKLCRGVSVFI